MKFTTPANSAKMEERPRGFIRRCSVISAPLSGLICFCLSRSYVTESHRKYDGRVRDDGISVRTNEHRGRTPKISRHAAMRRLDLGDEHREGSLETERGWCSTTNRYTYLPTCMREQTVSSGLDREEITEISEFSYFHVSISRICVAIMIQSFQVTYVCCAFLRQT